MSWYSLRGRSDKISISQKIVTVCLCALSAILAFSGIAKIIDSSFLIAFLQQAPILNLGSILIIATLIPIVEIGLAVALLIKWHLKTNLIITSCLFACFLAFTIYGASMGWSGNCGCFGGILESNFGHSMLIRNGLFLSLSVTALAVHNNKTCESGINFH